MTLAERPSSWLPRWAALSAVIGFLALQILAYAHAGLFEYPLDDVYIHLAMAQGIIGGTYGINPGEVASASSSILYPLLLLPFPGSEFQRLLPLLWNTAGVFGLGWLWGDALRLGGVGRREAVAMAVLGPIALNMPGVAYLGMEHTLHAIAALATLTGLWRFLTTGQVTFGLILGIVLAPMLRFEGAALSLLAASVLCLRGRFWTGAALAVTVVLTLGLFAGFLVHLGLEPLPSSVLAKVKRVGGSFDPVLTLALNLMRGQGALLGGLALVMMFVMLRWRKERGRPEFVLATVLALAIMAQLVLGQIGWLFRYEHYLIVVAVAGLILVGVRIGPLPQGAAVLALAVTAFNVLPTLIGSYSWNTRAIHLQQGQMARFAVAFLKAPVAVNDIGMVAWKTDSYVLDLWGLASTEALGLRVADAAQRTPGWAGKLAARDGVGYAMIYDQWLPGAMGDGWRLVAHLTMDPPKGQLGSFDVSFYAMGASHEQLMRAAVHAFAPTLPQGAVLTEVQPRT